MTHDKTSARTIEIIYEIPGYCSGNWIERYACLATKSHYYVLLFLFQFFISFLFVFDCFKLSLIDAYPRYPYRIADNRIIFIVKNRIADILTERPTHFNPKPKKKPYTKCFTRLSTCAFRE